VQYVALVLGMEWPLNADNTISVLEGRVLDGGGESSPVQNRDYSPANNYYVLYSIVIRYYCTWNVIVLDSEVQSLSCTDLASKSSSHYNEGTLVLQYPVI
jgi:hypothetical protein